MKIEIGESLLLSWLKHIKECQLVQLNWKASSKWELKNREILEQLMQNSRDVFNSKYGYEIYKGTQGIDQLIGQAEIDVMGVAFDGDSKHLYAIDVAFHEAGLNYGSRNETVQRIVKKCVRTAICIYGYFDIQEGTIIFTSPKIHQAVINDLNPCIEDITSIFKSLGLNYDVRIIGNEDFGNKVLDPILNVLGDVSDTSELFMRSLQMYNMFASKTPKTSVPKYQNKPPKIDKTTFEEIKYEGNEGLEEMKIGVVVRTVLIKMLEHGDVSKEEIALMQTKEYSKETFDITYPLLVKVSDTGGTRPSRYYAAPANIYNELYFVCSEWFEVPTNNDRPYLLKWIVLHKRG